MHFWRYAFGTGYVNRYMLRKWDCRVWPRGLVWQAANAPRTEEASVLILTLDVVLAWHACSCSGTWLANEKIAFLAHPIKLSGLGDVADGFMQPSIL